MSNKEKIIHLFYTKHLKPVDIALQLDISNSYVTKIIKNDSRYHKEKTQRKQQNKIKHKEQTIIEYIRKKQKSNKDSYEALKYQLEKDAEELSYYFDISNRSFRKFNASAYKYNSKRKRFEIDRKLNVSIDVPKTVY